MSFALGMRLGPYTILSRIGAGGMGEVYRARDNRLGREVAIKSLLPAYASDEERLLRFEREAKSVALLNHPAIIQVYDTGVHEGRPYLVMELLEGECLRTRLNAGPIPPKRAAEIALQVAQGLAAAHEKGLIHRDLKPENLFLLRDGRVKILDFGLAKLRPTQDEDLNLTMADPDPALATRVGVVVGTVGYMSPEQVGGRPLDGRSDLFSLGVVLWEMLAGRRPFQRDSAVETLHAILKLDPDLQDIPRSLPPTLERTLLRCLQKDPQQRFQSAADLAFDLEGNLSVGQSSMRNLPSLRTRWFRPFPWKGAGAAILAVGLIGAALWAGWALRKPTPLAFHRLTYQNGIIRSACFAGDGKTYAFTQGPETREELFLGRVDGNGARRLEVPQGSRILAVSRSGEMALLLPSGVLAKAGLGGGAPKEILEGVLYADWTPDGGELAVIRRAGESRERLEFPIGHPIFETTGAQPLLENVRVSPQGDRVAFTHHPLAGHGELWVGDRTGHRQLLFQGTPDSLAWAPDGKSILFTCRLREDRYELRSVDLDGRYRTIYPIVGRLDILGVSPEGRVLLKHSVTREGLMARGPGDARERDLSWLQTSSAADLTRDGRRLLFGERHEGVGPGGAYLRDLAGGEPVRLGDGDPVSLSPDGKWALVAVLDGNGSMVLLPTGPGTPIPLPMAGLRPEWGVFLPDASGLLLGAVGPKGFGYYRMNLADRVLQPWGSAPMESATCLVSPDGRTVALGPIEGGLELRDIDGKILRRIPGLGHRETPIQWAEGGKTITVADLETTPPRVFRFDLATGRKTLWRELPSPDPDVTQRISYLAMTPRGDAYVYSYRRVLTSTLYLMDGVF